MTEIINSPKIKTVKAIKGYGQVQTCCLEIEELSLHARFLYAWLCSKTGSKEYCWPKIKYISDKTRICERKVRSSLNELYNFGLIEKGKLYPKSANRTNKYTILRVDNQDDEDVDNFKESEVIQGQPAPPCRLGTKEENVDSRPTGTTMPVEPAPPCRLYNKELNNNKRTTTDSEGGLSVFLKSLSDPTPENISEAYCYLQKEKGVKIDSMKRYARGIQNNIESGQRDIEDLKSKIQEHVDNKQSVTKQHLSWIIQTEHQKKDRLEISKQQSKDSDTYKDIDSLERSEFERLENIAKQNIQPKQILGDMYSKFLKAEILEMYKAEFKEKYSLPVNQGNITYIESANTDITKDKNLKEVSMV